MPDIFSASNSDPVKWTNSTNSAGDSTVISSSDDSQAETFSFQSPVSNSSSSGSLSPASPSASPVNPPDPALPVETISLQDLSKQSEKVDLSINEKSSKLKEEVPPEETDFKSSTSSSTDSFLARFQTEIVEDKPQIEEMKMDEPTPPAQPEPTSQASSKTQGYQMPDLPKESPISKIFPIFIFLIVVCLLGFGIYRFLPIFNKPKQVSLIWWGLWEDEKTMKPVIDAYMKQKPNITVTYVKQNPKEYRIRLQSAIARGQGPDIFRFHNTWSVMLASELGSLPETKKTSLNFSKIFYPTAYYDLVKNDKIYGIPLMYESLALFYNEEMFKNASLEVPKSWVDVTETAKRLTVKDDSGNLKISGLAIGNTAVDHWSDILGLMMFQNGADPAYPNDQCAKEAIQYYLQFGVGDQKTWDENLGRSTLAFASGKAAMYLGPSWEIFEIKKMNPDLEFKISSFPQITGGKRYWATYWAEGVNAKSENQDAAWDFLLFLSQKETLQLLYSEEVKSGPERVIGELYPRTDMLSLLKDDVFAAPFLEGATASRGWYLSSRTFDEGINDNIIKYYEDALNKLTRGESGLEDALQTVNSGVAQIYKQYNLTLPTSNPDCQIEQPAQ